MKNKFLNKNKIFFEFLIIYLLYLFLLLLPINIVSNLGGFIFKIIGPLTKVNTVIKKNLLLMFPSIKKSQIKTYSLQSWENLGKTLFELLILTKIMKDKKKISIKGGGNIKKIIANKEKVIFIGIHQSNWEILMPSIDKLGIPVGGIYRHINNHYINKLILKIRKKNIKSNLSFYTPKGKTSANDIIRGIKKEISLTILVDQKDSAGEIINFFNFPSKTQIGFIKIARKYNMKIIPVENIRDKFNNFTLIFHKPITNIFDDLSDIEIMNNLNIMIEEWIKKDPSKWFLQHNRFN